MEAVRRAGGTPVRLGTDRDLATALEAIALSDPSPPGGVVGAPDSPPRVIGAVVDLFARRYDGADAVRRIAAARLPVIAVAEHDDLPTRRAALDAGALRVFSYNRFFSDGPRLVEAWIHPTGGRS